MHVLSELFESNRQWVDGLTQVDPDLFSRLATGQHPRYLWFGCSDSRVPPDSIIGALPGDVFVHRNISNLVRRDDDTAMAVLQYAIDDLRVPHVIVCGHYGCGGVQAAATEQATGRLETWLEPVRQLQQDCLPELMPIEDDATRFNRLAELNVFQQVANICQSVIVQAAWKRGQQVAVHGLIYGTHDGVLRDMDLCIHGPDGMTPIFRFCGQVE